MAEGNIKIIIVEDESIVALDIRNNLRKLGYEVSGIFASGEAVLESVESLMPDLVLMDLKLQGKLDGIETAEIIKKMYKIPVILLTAYADNNTLQRAKELGPFGYIIKPFESRELHITIEMAIYRSNIEKKLWASEEKYRKLFEDDLSADFITDNDGRIVDCNPSFVNTFQLNEKHLISSMNFSDLFPDNGTAADLLAEIKDKKRIELLELNLKTQNSEKLTILANLIGSFNEDGSFTGLQGYLIDITQRKTLEHQLRQSQKMEAIGRLAGGVAHDFNNILTVIFGYVSILEENQDVSHIISSELDGLKSAAVRASSLTRQLLAFSRRQLLQPQPVELDTLVKDMEKMMRRLITEDVSISLNLLAAGCVVTIDPGQFEQVLINLVVNSRDAMSGGGEIKIITGRITIDDCEDMQLGRLNPGEYYLLEVRDTGEGIKSEDVTKIFDPFFTTKPEDRGTGLGLSTVYGIIKQSGGNMRVSSEVHKGTVFSIYLPVINSPARKIKHQAPEAVITGGNETILLVEDDPNVREMVSLILAQNGYNVLTAEGAHEAFLKSENFSQHIDLLFTDLIMPNMNGDVLAERIINDREGLKVLIMSGYPDKSAAINSIQKRGWHFLHKPFDNSMLLSCISDILSS